MSQLRIMSKTVSTVQAAWRFQASVGSKKRNKKINNFVIYSNIVINNM